MGGPHRRPVGCGRRLREPGGVGRRPSRHSRSAQGRGFGRVAVMTLRERSRGAMCAASLVAACGSNSAAPPPVATIAVELGIGAGEFTPLTDGQTVNIVGTPQAGGFRIV